LEFTLQIGLGRGNTTAAKCEGTNWHEMRETCQLKIGLKIWVDASEKVETEKSLIRSGKAVNRRGRLHH
jgi:hypothetical protein